jgi:hypothetical protein
MLCASSIQIESRAPFQAKPGPTRLLAGMGRRFHDWIAEARIRFRPMLCSALNFTDYS